MATPACHCINKQGMYEVKPASAAAASMAASRVLLDDFCPQPQSAYRPGKHMAAGEARRDHIIPIMQGR